MGKIVDMNRKRSAKARGAAGSPPERDSKTALVLTGGGFAGGVYQIGALRALDLVGANTTVNDFDIYVGTSAGAFIASLVANGCRPEDLMAVLDGNEVAGYEPLELNKLLRPNYGEIVSRGMRLPLEAVTILKDILLNIHKLSFFDIVTMVGELAPGGLYSVEGMSDLLSRQLARDGFTADFRELAKELYLVAVDLDTTEAIVFGEPGWDDVPIPLAAAASGALPLVYKSVPIRGREFVDGGLRSFANVDTAVEHGAKLVVIVNPVVPFVNDRLNPPDRRKRRRISQMGMTSVMQQTFKLLVWSALHERLAHWQQEHPGVDFILIEPQVDDALMFHTHFLNTSARVQVARHGFESVTVQLGSDFERYRDICARHGIEISRRRVIEALDRSRSAESTTSRWRTILERGAQVR